MKYVFIAVAAWVIIKTFILKNIRNRLLFYSLCIICVLLGVLGLIYDISFYDIIGGLIHE